MPKKKGLRRFLWPLILLLSTKDSQKCYRPHPFLVVPISIESLRFYHSSLWSIWSMLISLIKAENKRKLSLIATGKTKSFLVNVLENLNMVSLFKKHERSGFLHLSCFFWWIKNKSPARLVLCSMFLSKVVVSPQHTRGVLMVGKFQTDLIC